MNKNKKIYSIFNNIRQICKRNSEKEDIKNKLLQINGATEFANEIKEAFKNLGVDVTNPESGESVTDAEAASVAIFAGTAALELIDMKLEEFVKKLNNNNDLVMISPLKNWIVEELEDSIHVVPNNDIDAHELSPNCKCNPKMEMHNLPLFTHNSFDKRELKESSLNA